MVAVTAAPLMVANSGSGICRIAKEEGGERLQRACILLQAAVEAKASRHSLASLGAALFRSLDEAQEETSVQQRLKAVAPALREQLAKSSSEAGGRLPPVSTGSLRRQRNLALHCVDWRPMSAPTTPSASPSVLPRGQHPPLRAGRHQASRR
eukprot:646586-Prorocentrum_lima.AAC.1